MAIIPFTLIFVLGELLFNFTLFPYLKRYFKVDSDHADETEIKQKIFKLELSVFKGILERFVLYFGLILGVSHIVILFGALKIGTRLDKGNKISNDYFLVGNFSSLLIALLYYFLTLDIRL